MELSYERLHRWLEYFKINTNNNYRPYLCHASGHASGPDLINFIEMIDPKILLPIHTENPEKFKKMFKGNTITPTLNKSIII
jgi:ribonuclease J